MTKPLKGEECIKAAKRAGWEIENCKGSHIKIIAPTGEHQVVYPGEMSTGVSCKVSKWFKMFGIILMLIMALAYMYYLP